MYEAADYRVPLKFPRPFRLLVPAPSYFLFGPHRDAGRREMRFVRRAGPWYRKRVPVPGAARQQICKDARSAFLGFGLYDRDAGLGRF